MDAGGGGGGSKINRKKMKTEEDMFRQHTEIDRNGV